MLLILQRQMDATEIDINSRIYNINGIPHILNINNFVIKRLNYKI